MVGRDVELAVLCRIPEDAIGDQVAEVGLLGADAGIAVAVEIDFGLCEDFAEAGIHVRDDLVGQSLDGLVLGLDALELDQLVLFDLLRRVIDDDHADIFQRRACGLDRLFVLALGHDGVRMAVNDEVDAGGTGIEVGGAVGVGFLIHAEMRQRDDDVRAALLERGGLLRGEVIKLVLGHEGHALDLGGMGLGSGLRRGQAEEADLDAARSGDSCRAVEGQLSIVLDVADDLELGILENGLEVGEAIVEFMVAERRDIIAHRVHQLDRGLALRIADIGRALNVVARVHKDDVGALFCVVLFQCCYLCVQADRTVHVVGVQDDGLPGQLSVRGQRAGHQTEHQNNGQKKCYEFFHSILLYFLPPDGGKITKAVPHFRLSTYYTAFAPDGLSAVFRKKKGIFRDSAQKPQVRFGSMWLC